MKMRDPTTLYDQKYSDGYRDRLTGYEIARWKALEHFVESRIAERTGLRRILDYGAGSGLHVRLWERLFPGAELHFCDISSVALHKLRSRYPQHGNCCHHFRDGRADIGDGLFQLVVSIEVAEHVKDLVSYLRDIHRLLEPGGGFLWTTPCANRMSLEHVFSAWTGTIEATREGYRRWTWEDPTHVTRMKSSEMKRLLNRHGFRDVRFRFRAHLFSFLCTRLSFGRYKKIGDQLMLLDYALFRCFPNGASMIGYAKKET